MAAPTPVTIKLRYHSGQGLWVRRTVEHPGFGFVAFRKWATESFPGLDLTQVRVTYLDEDGDECAISNQRDFREAIELYCHLGKALRIEMVDLAATPRTAQPEEVAVNAETTDTNELDGNDTPPPTPPSSRGVSLRDIAIAALQEVEMIIRDPQPGPLCQRISRSPLLRSMVSQVRDPEFMRQISGMGEAFAELARTVVTASQMQQQQQQQAQQQPASSASTTPSASSAASSRAASPVADVVTEEVVHDQEEEVKAQEEKEEATPSATRTQETEEQGQEREGEMERSVHDRVMCDGCGAEPIVGTRYKDAVRRNFDLCEACEAREDSPYPFLVISDPSQAPAAVLTILPDPADVDWDHDDPPVHLHVSCNACGEGPILGTRYKCTQRDDYDLCETCQRSDRSGLPLLKIKKPSQTPARIQTYAPGDRPPRGLRRGQHQRWREHFGRGHCPNRFGGGRHHHFHPFRHAPPQYYQHGIQQPRCGGGQPAPVKVLAFEEESQQHHNQNHGHQQQQPPSINVEAPVRGIFPCPQQDQVHSQESPVVPVRVVSPRSLQAEEDRLLEQAVQASLDEMAALEVVAALSSNIPSAEASVTSHVGTEQVSVQQSLTSDQRTEERQVADEMTATSDSVKGGAEEDGEEVASVSTLTVDEVVSPTVMNAAMGRGFTFSDLRHYGARFIRDKTIPDGTVLPPRTRINKTWVLQNHGTAPFPENTRLVFSYGHLMEGPTDGFLVGRVEPEETFEVTVALVTPRERGQFIGYWHLEATEEDGRPVTIGSRVWVDVTVDTSADGWQFVEVGERLSQSLSDDTEGDDQLLKELAEEMGGGASGGGAASPAPVLPTPPTREVEVQVDDISVVTAEVQALSHSMSSATRLEDSEVVGDNGNEGEQDHPQAEEVVEPNLNEVPIAAVEATPTAIPVPTIEVTPEVVRWADQLHQLFDMGFEDLANNVRELERHYQQGGLDAVVEGLLGGR